MTTTRPFADSTMTRLLLGIVGLVAAALVLAACSGRTVVEAGSTPGAVLPPATQLGEGASGFSEEIAVDATPRPADTAPTTLADLVTPLGSAEFQLDRLAAEVEQAGNLAQPATISIPSLGLDEAAIIAVGVEPNGDMQIPPAEQVGWYRFGPRPGEPGSAVLAGHIAYNGVDGAFRYLADLEVGKNFSIGFTDGSTVDYVVTDLQTYLKAELPRDELFEQSGPARLVLITCGGSFNYDASSYESNVVAYAVAV